ncbi:hypothetical protein LCGC14_1959760, partial [marine sediment metagenome]
PNCLSIFFHLYPLKFSFLISMWFFATLYDSLHPDMVFLPILLLHYNYRSNPYYVPEYLPYISLLLFQ